MNAQPVIVHLPPYIYHRLKNQAQVMQHTVDEELTEMLINAWHDDPNLDDNLEYALAQLDLLNDDDLLYAAQSSLSHYQTAQMQTLLDKQQRQGLSESEGKIAQHFSDLFNRTMLIRAKALALLQERGHDIKSLLQPSYV